MTETVTPLEPHNVVLNPEQSAGVMFGRMGSNLFITGGGGRGKSVVIRELTDERTLIVAPTAQAALNVGGKTLHSAFGITPKKVITPTSKTFSKLKNIPSKLIIDEIGMVRSDYLDYMDRCLRRSTGIKEPFGGVQVIMAGDFFQIPPIVPPKEANLFKGTTPYAFSSKVWNEMSRMDVILTKSERQGNEEHARILDEIRVCGERTPLAVRKVNLYAQKYNHSLHKDITVLCYVNRQADSHNRQMFNSVPSEARSYPVEVRGNAQIVKNAPKEVSLKVGAKVIITSNKYDQGDRNKLLHYNGQQGEVISLGVDYIVVKADNGDRVYVEYMDKDFYDVDKQGKRVVVATLSSLPVKLGWAITVHSAQGMTLDQAVLDNYGGAFTTGLLYVALSRIRSLSNLILKQAVRICDVKVDPRVVEFYNNL